MTKKVILTGDRPTGPLHLGHYVGSLKNRVALQQQQTYTQYVMIADVQGLTDNAENAQKIRDNVIEVALDYLAVGLDPSQTTIFIQSLIPEIPELTMYYFNLLTVAQLERNPTVKDEIRQRGFEKSVPVGFLVYPVNQVADITCFNAHLVPVGRDQLPIIELAHEIVQRFNRLYGEVFVEPQALIPDAEQGRLVGTDGKAKMSKSLGNAIFLSDKPDQIEKKVMSMYTDPDHLHVQDPGKVEGNAVFTYLDVFDTNKHYVQELKAHYRRGGLGDVKIKRYLNDVLQSLLKPIRERREAFAHDKGQVWTMLKGGTERARHVTVQTLQSVRKAMKLDYF